MLIRKNDKGQGELVILIDDKIGRADARLVSLLARITRELKGHGKMDSTYHCEDSYKQDKSIATFDWADLDRVVKVVRLNSFDVKVQA
jgi:pullulanase/glycogen debranching enzyme